jgi:integrase
VPVVSYQLWSETLALLKQERSPGGKGRVLLNRNESPLVFDDVDKDGKPIKCDNIRNAFGRVCKKTDIGKPLKALKKTSATLLRGHRHYASLYDLFLGHAPTTMADKHYTLPPQDLLDEALGWLRDEFEIAEALKAE